MHLNSLQCPGHPQTPVPAGGRPFEVKPLRQSSRARFRRAAECGPGCLGVVVGQGWHEGTADTAQRERKGRERPGKEGEGAC